MSKSTTIIFSIIASILMIVSLFFLWLQKDIFNSQNFAAKTRTVLQSENVTNALAREVVDQSLKDKPLVKNVAGDTLERVISSLIESPRFGSIIERLATAFQTVITTEIPESISIDLTGIKNIVQPIVSQIDPSIAPEAAGVTVPDQIVLTRSREIPSIYPLSKYLWLGPVAGIIALLLIAYMIYRSYKNGLTYTLKTIGLAVLIFSLLAALIIPNIERPIANKVGSANIRQVIDTLYQAFTQDLLNWLYFLISLAILTIIAGFWIGYKRSHRT